MSVSDLLDGAFRGLRATFGPVALLVLVLVAPLTLLSNLALDRFAPTTFQAGAFPGAFDQQPGPVDDVVGEVAAVFGIGTLVGIVSYLVGLLISAAVVALVLDVDRGREADLKVALRTALGVLGTTLGASLLLIAGAIVAFIGYVLISLVMLLVPVAGIVLWVLTMLPLGFALVVLFLATTSLVVPIAVTERAGVIETLGRVWWVLKVRLWRVVGITLLVGLVLLAITAGVQFGTQVAAFAVPGTGWALVSVGEIAAQLISIPVTAFAALLIYLDARIRSEGLDVQLRARGLAP